MPEKITIHWAWLRMRMRMQQVGLHFIYFHFTYPYHHQLATPAFYHPIVMALQCANVCKYRVRTSSTELLRLFLGFGAKKNCIPYHSRWVCVKYLVYASLMLIAMISWLASAIFVINVNNKQHNVAITLHVAHLPVIVLNCTLHKLCGVRSRVCFSLSLSRSPFHLKAT